MYYYNYILGGSHCGSAEIELSGRTGGHRTDGNIKSMFREVNITISEVRGM